MSAATEATVPELEAIALGAAPGASDVERTAAIRGCHAILARLTPPLSAATTGEPVARALEALRGMSADAVLDLAIARMRAALPAGVSIPGVEPLRIRMVGHPPKR